MMISVCELCGQVIDNPVDAVMHYERIGRASDCDRRIARGFGLKPGVVVSLGSGIDARRRRLT